MPYHELFWATIATVTPVVALAQAIVTRALISAAGRADSMRRRANANVLRYASLVGAIEQELPRGRGGLKAARAEGELQGFTEAVSALRDEVEREGVVLRTEGKPLRESLWVVALGGVAWLIHLFVLTVSLVSLATQDDVVVPMAPAIAEAALFGLTPLLLILAQAFLADTPADADSGAGASAG